MKTFFFLYTFIAFVFAYIDHAAACDYTQDGHIVGVDGSSMPTLFIFQMDVDSVEVVDGPTPVFAGAGEWIRYDGTLSGNNAQANTRVIYSEALSAMLTGKMTRNCGKYAYTADGGRDLVSQGIRVYSSN